MNDVTLKIKVDLSAVAKLLCDQPIGLVAPEWMCNIFQEVVSAVHLLEHHGVGEPSEITFDNMVERYIQGMVDDELKEKGE